MSPSFLEQPVTSCQADKPKRLGVKARGVLSTLSQLEASLSSECENTRADVKEVGIFQKQNNFAHHRRRLAVYTARQGVDTATSSFSSAPFHENLNGVSKPFTNFCEKLLVQNRIWNQQKEIKSLKRTLETTKSANASHAFQAFCDRLLMSNNIWKLEREVEQLKEEGAKLKRSRVTAVTRAAKQMVQDVRKERLTEEYVKDLIDEMDGYRRTVITLRAEHEKEIAEMAEEFKKESRRMSRQIEQLQLAQESRRIEQDLTNQMEDELLARLRRQTPTYVDGSAQTEFESAYADDDLETLDGDSDYELSSNLSTSTFVGSAGPSTPNDKSLFAKDSVIAKPSPFLRRRATTHLTSLRRPHRTMSTSSLRSEVSFSTTAATTMPRKVETTEYVGFSFNPLFFGNATISRTEDGVKVESSDDDNLPFFHLKAPPVGQRESKLLSKASTTSLRSTESSLPQPKRVAWRV